MDCHFFTDNSHRRWNPLTDSWLLCSPHRAKRPWLGQNEETGKEEKPEYDAQCYLCPTNARAGGQLKNPAYDSTYVFPNDFPAVKQTQPAYNDEAKNSTEDSIRDLASNLLKVEGVRGQCKVVCFSPKHNLTMAEMDTDSIAKVIDTWSSEYVELGKLDYINYVQIFENKGSIMGCSNPHGHNQIWALEHVPEEPAKELRAMQKYHDGKGTCLLCDYSKLEATERSRLVCENDSFLCVVPFWAIWPYETMIIAKQHVISLPELDQKQKVNLADILRRLTCRYDNVFEASFPYSMGIHGAPSDGKPHANDCHLHIHFYPPLLRSATVKKFLVGYVGSRVL